MSVLALLERGAPLAYALSAICASIAIAASLEREPGPMTPNIVAPPPVVATPPAVVPPPVLAEPPAAPTVVPRPEPTVEPETTPAPEAPRRVRPKPALERKVISKAPEPLAPDPELELTRGLERRGLTLADLERLPAVAGELERVRAGRAQSLDDLWSTLAETTLPTPLLRAKLDELRDLLARRSPTLDPQVATALEESYLRLESELAAGPTVAGRHRLAADVRTVRLRLLR